jgi:hypothetical protein
MLTENQRKVIDLLSKEKETEEFSSMVLFASNERLILTVNYDLVIDFDCEMDVQSKDMMVSLKSFNALLKIMPSPTIYCEFKDVVFKSGDVLIKLSNMYGYNKDLGEALLQTTFTNYMGSLKFSDIILLNKALIYDKVFIEHSRIILKKKHAYYHIPILSVVPEKFVFPKTFLKMLNSYGQDVRISSNSYRIYLNSFSDLRFNFSRAGCEDDTTGSVDLESLEEVAVFDSLTLSKDLYSYVLPFKSGKNIKFTFQKNEQHCVFFIQEIRGEMTSSLVTKSPINKKVAVTVNLIELKRIIKKLTQPTAIVKIDDSNKILFIDNMPLSFI